MQRRNNGALRRMESNRDGETNKQKRDLAETANC